MSEEFSTNVPNGSPRKTAQNYACVVCAHRKVKCDRQQPCSNCVKGDATCEYRAPPPAKRRKRKQTDEQETLAKLDRYEKLLNNLGIDVDGRLDDTAALSPDTQRSEYESERGHRVVASPPNAPPEPSRVVDDGIREGRTRVAEYRASGIAKSEERMFVQGSRSRYTENSLWGSLSDEILRPRDMLAIAINPKAKDSSNMAGAGDICGPGSLLFEFSPNHNELRHIHPSVAHIKRLWQLFRQVQTRPRFIGLRLAVLTRSRTNVDPLIKLFDINMKEKWFMGNIQPQLDGTSKHSSALYFAIYLCAITSLEDDECLREFGETRAVLFDRYQAATEQSLVAARLLHTSDMFVLQAFFMYMLCMRQRLDAGSIWILNGVAVRMAQKGGLHRDADYLDANTWPWHAEMRRRMWWQLILHDGRNAELSGFGKSVWSSFKWDAKQPRNINDDEMSAEGDLPPSRTGATDMMFCSMTYEISSFFREVEPLGKPSLDDKEGLIDELERRLEQKYLSYCDLLIPLHLLCSIIARCTIVTLRFRVCYGRLQADSGNVNAQAGKDRLFGLALKVLEYESLAHSTKSIRKFKFHLQSHFGWHQLIFVLGELRTRTTGNDADRAWTQLQEVFEHRPEILKPNGTALQLGLANLALKVWDARMKEFERQLPGVPMPKTPPFIEEMQASFASAEDKKDGPSTGPPRQAPYDPVRTNEAWRQGPQNGHADFADWESSILQNGPMQPANYSQMGAIDPSPSNWPEWDDLILQDLTYVPGFDASLDLFGGTGF